MEDAALVIVNYRSADLVLRCLQATGPSGETLVVDNASGDGSVERLRAAGVEVLARDSNDGFAAGVNAGFAATTKPYVVLLNPDTEPRPGALETLLAHLRSDPRLGVAAPQLVGENGEVQPNAYRRYPGRLTLFAELCLPIGFALDRLPRLDPYRYPRGHAGPCAHVTGAALAIRRAAYEAAGPLDEGYFMYLEETEWQRRVAAAGYTIDAVPQAEVVHLVRGGDGGDLAPSPHFLASARRYLGRGAGPLIATALLGSRAFIALMRVLFPSRRELNAARAAAWRELWSRR